MFWLDCPLDSWYSHTLAFDSFLQHLMDQSRTYTRPLVAGSSPKLRQMPNQWPLEISVMFGGLENVQIASVNDEEDV